MRARKIDDNCFLDLLNQGKLQKEAAKELGISETAITKRLKKRHPEGYQVPGGLRIPRQNATDLPFLYRLDRHSQQPRKVK